MCNTIIKQHTIQINDISLQQSIKVFIKNDNINL